MKITDFFSRPALTFRLALRLLGALACAPLVVAGCSGTTSAPALPASYRPGADLIYSAVTQPSNAFTARVLSLSASGANNLRGSLTTGGDGTQNLELSGINRVVNVPAERRFEVILESPAGQSFVPGQVFPLAFGTRNNILIRQSSTNGDRLWQSEGGSAQIISVGRDSIQLRLIDARFVPSPTFFASGTFLLNGTLGATGLRVVAG